MTTPQQRPVQGRRLATPGDDRRCWLCGVVDPRGRADMYMPPHVLCGECWPHRPAASHRGARDGSAVLVALGLPQAWTGGRQQGWARLVAAKHGISAWYDTPANLPRPVERWDWLPVSVLNEAAVHLGRLEAEHRRMLVPPSAR